MNSGNLPENLEQKKVKEASGKNGHRSGEGGKDDIAANRK